MKKNPVVHFEMPFDNAERIKNFYSTAFGWDLTQFGEEMGNYITAHTAETDENQMVKTPGAINGGFFPRKPDSPQIPSVVISVTDITEAMGKVTAQGGEVLGEPIEIPGIGHYVSFKDTEGNRVSLLQPHGM